MSIVAFKILSILAIILAGVIGGLLPQRVSQTEAGVRNLILGNALAGGVFLGAGLLHLLVDGSEHMAQFLSNADYPYTLLVCGIGFLLVLLLEKVLLKGEELDLITENARSFPLALILVLSIHSIIAGAALGLETNFVSSIALFAAIIAHKGIAAFALGVNLVDARVPAQQIRNIVLLFSITTPLGILLGTISSGILESQAAHGAEALFDSLAAGTFIYIAVMEIISDVYASQRQAWPKFSLTTGGFLFMALLAVWA